MVDNFALFVSQLMMIVVLWRCYFMPADGDDAIEERRMSPPKRRAANKRPVEKRDTKTG